MTAASRKSSDPLRPDDVDHHSSSYLRQQPATPSIISPNRTSAMFASAGRFSEADRISNNNNVGLQSAYGGSAPSAAAVGSSSAPQAVAPYDRIRSALNATAANFDITTSAGLLATAFPVWCALAAWAAARIVIAGEELSVIRRLYQGADRQVFDFSYVWQIISSAMLLVMLLYQFMSIVWRSRSQLGKENSSGSSDQRPHLSQTTTAVFIQGIVSVSVMMYTDRLAYGTEMVLLVLPLLGTLFLADSVAVGVGWLLCTGTVIVVNVADVYFPVLFRFENNTRSPIISSIVYGIAAAVVMLVSQLYQHWLRKTLHEQERTVQFATVVSELLTTMNTDEALKAIDIEEARLRAMQAKAPKNMRSNINLLLQTAASYRKLTMAMAKYRSYLPNNLFVQGAQDFDDDPESNEDDDNDDDTGDDDASVDSSRRPARTVRTIESGTAVGAMSVLDPYLLDQSNFKRRWSTVICVSITSSISDAHMVQDVGDRFCQAVVPRIVSSRGVIDRLGPTSILASFNCHTPCVFHPSEAATCALAIAADLNQHPDIVFSIVIASGMNYIGTCGVDTHRARVVLGESVEIVQRLLSLAATTLCCRIVLTEDTANRIGFETAPIDTVILNPAAACFTPEKPITVFELRSAKKENTPIHLATAFSTAFATLRSGDYIKAHTMLQNYVERNPTDFQASRLRAMCAPLARELALQIQKINNSSSGALTPAAAAAALDHLITPYARREVIWESSKAEDEFVRAQEFNQLSSAVVVSVDAPTSAANGVANLGDTVRQHLQQSQKISDTGLFDMFISNDDDSNVQEQSPADHYYAATDESDLTGIPKSFQSADAKWWRRSARNIGSGAFAQLYLALSEQGDLLAMKCFDLSAHHTQTEELIEEVKTLSKLRDEHIVGYAGYALLSNHFIILMEYVSGGSLYDMLQQFGPLPIAAAKRYLKNLLHGLRHLHEDWKMTHCDIKPHNALLANDGTCKLSDFGSSVNNQVRQQQQQHRAGHMNSGGAADEPQVGTEEEPCDDQLIVRGTSWYMAPEAARGEIKPANDIWSLGITFHEMLTAKLPWPDALRRTKEEIFIQRLGKDETMIPVMDPCMPEEARDFLADCFQRDAERRPTVDKLLLHRFLAA